MAKKGGSKQKKMNSRVDFTPMVDMIMLLVTFFMLCTTLIKPQTMEIAMPAEDDGLKNEQKSQVQTNEAITIILDKDNKIYYFEGKPSEAVLKETAYGREGIRAVLLEKNAEAAKKRKELEEEYQKKYTANVEQAKKNQEDFKKALSEIKNADGTPTAIIKPTDEASYKNLVDLLDEMQICTIGKYVIDKVNDTDKALLAKAKGGN